MFAVSCLFVSLHNWKWEWFQLEERNHPKGSDGRWPDLNCCVKDATLWLVWHASQLWWRPQTQPNVGMHSTWRPPAPTFSYSLTSWKCDVKFSDYTLCAYIRRSKLSYEDGSGNVAIKTIPPRPSGVSLRSQVEPARGLVNLLQVPTSPQCDIWRGWQNDVVLSEMVLYAQQRY